jgi:hypothetical protein
VIRHSTPIKRKKQASRRNGVGKREANRQLAGLGLSRHDDEDVRTEALAIVGRFLAWVRTQPCVVSGKRTGDVMEHAGQDWRVVVQAAHVVRTRGAFGGDFGVVVPLVDLLHRQQEDSADFWMVHSSDPVELARLIAWNYLRAHDDDRTWLLARAQDGDVLQLARAALAGR